MKKRLFLGLFLMTMVFADATVCYANSAEPPSILIIVANAPADLEVHMGNAQALRTDKAFESYYTFYSREIRSADNTLRFTTGSTRFEITINDPLKRYNNIFTLDLKHQTLARGKSLSRSIGLPLLRIALTLMIEGLVFFLFGFRKKASWLVFIIVNLLTQGILNIMLAENISPLNGYLVFTLIGGEIIVFLVEIVAFLTLLNEHGLLRRLMFVISANLLSLIAGGYLIAVLPL